MATTKAPVSLPDFLNLDWRKCPPPLRLLQLLDELMSQIDSDAKISVVLSSSKAKRFVDADESSLDHDMILQAPRWTVRACHTDVSAGNAGDYCARLICVILFIMSKLDEQQVGYKRSTFYELRSDRISDSQIDQCTLDLALTLNLHPASLGFVAESKSIVQVPDGVKIEVKEVTRIHEWAADKTQGLRVTTMRSGRSVPIPALPLEISLVEGDIRAVVVSEHRNAQQILQGYENQPAFRGILLVLVGGFADSASREFLHLLSAHPSLAETKFLFVSDCDPYGKTIYSNLKYGSFASAYASPLMICPRLVYGGLIMSEWKGFAGGHAQRQLDARLRVEPNMSAAKQAKELKILQAKSDASVEMVLAAPTARLDSKGLERLNGLLKQGVFNGESEAIARAEVQRMIEEKTVLSLWDLNHFGDHGVAYYIRDVVAAARSEQDNLPVNAFHAMSQDRSRWAARAHRRPLSNVELDLEMIEEDAPEEQIVPADAPATAALSFDEADI